MLESTGDCCILLKVKRFNNKLGHRFLYLLGFKHVLLYLHSDLSIWFGSNFLAFHCLRRSDAATKYILKSFVVSG